MLFKGSYVAIVTPFNDDKSVNFEKFGELIEYHIAKKTDGIVVLGTTGESPTLSHEEDEAVVEFAIKKANGRIPLIIGSGSNSTETAIVQSKKFEAMGAPALLVITPYYNKTNKEGMYNHFKRIAESVNVPIIMYNVPGRTGCNIDVDVVERLSKIKNIAGIKEASGNISYATKIAKFISDDFCMFSGNDDIILPMLSIGACGVISVAANIIPDEIHDICECYEKGDTNKAKELQLKYLSLINTLFIETNPIPVKHAMNILGMNVGPLREPLYPMADSNKEKLIKELEIIK